MKFKKLSDLLSKTFTKKKYKTKIILIRHAESIGNTLPLIQSQINYDLSINGEKQAKEIKKEIFPLLEKFEWIFSSPYERAVRTCEIILESKQERNFEFKINGDFKDFNEKKNDKIKMEFLENKFVEYGNNYDEDYFYKKKGKKNLEKNDFKEKNNEFDIGKIDGIIITSPRIKKKEKKNIYYSIEKNLIDLNIGNMEGAFVDLERGSAKDIQNIYYILNNHILQPKNCESEFDMRKRISKILRNLPEGVFLFFTHAGVIYKLRQKFGRKGFIGNCGAISVGFDDWEQGYDHIGWFEGFYGLD